MENIRIDSKKSLEIMTEVVRSINSLNDITKNLKNKLDSITTDNVWVCENADIFKGKSLNVLSSFSICCQDMYKDVLLLIDMIEKYEKIDKEVSTNV